MYPDHPHPIRPKLSFFFHPFSRPSSRLSSVLSIYRGPLTLSDCKHKSTVSLRNHPVAPVSSAGPLAARIYTIPACPTTPPPCSLSLPIYTRGDWQHSSLFFFFPVLFSSFGFRCDTPASVHLDPLQIRSYLSPPPHVPSAAVSYTTEAPHQIPAIESIVKTARSSVPSPCPAPGRRCMRPIMPPTTGPVPQPIMPSPQTST